MFHGLFLLILFFLSKLTFITMLQTVYENLMAEFLRFAHLLSRNNYFFLLQQSNIVNPSPQSAFLLAITG